MTKEFSNNPLLGQLSLRYCTLCFVIRCLPIRNKMFANCIRKRLWVNIWQLLVWANTAEGAVQKICSLWPKVTLSGASIRWLFTQIMNSILNIIMHKINWKKMTHANILYRDNKYKGCLYKKHTKQYGLLSALILFLVHRYTHILLTVLNNLYW